MTEGYLVVLQPKLNRSCVVVDEVEEQMSSCLECNHSLEENSLRLNSKGLQVE